MSDANAKILHLEYKQENLKMSIKISKVAY